MLPTELLVAKYSGSGPRYTSYPTAAELREGFPLERWKKLVFDLGTKRPAAFYVHLPFCRSLCYFCACHKIVTSSHAPVERYLRALSAEMQLYSAVLRDGVLVDHLHLGGGTPNFLHPPELERLIGEFNECFPDRTDDAELSIELDPRTASADHIRMLSYLGFTRISCGVQDFDPDVQEAINRRQSYEETRDLIDSARQAGIVDMNIDLIYGLPRQTMGGFARTLDQVAELRPERIALYGYAHLPSREKVQTGFRRHPIPSPKERIALFSLAVERLALAGYIHIGLDHFALPADQLAQAMSHGRLRRNFMGYTDRVCEPLIGFGLSAISSCGGALSQNEKDLVRYEKRLLEEHTIPVVRGLERSRDDSIRADLIERILCERKIDCKKFSCRWGIDFYAYFADCLPALDELEYDGLVCWSNAALEVTEVGSFFLRTIAMVFDRYLSGLRAAGSTMFSQTV